MHFLPSSCLTRNQTYSKMQLSNSKKLPQNVTLSDFQHKHACGMAHEYNICNMSPEGDAIKPLDVCPVNSYTCVRNSERVRVNSSSGSEGGGLGSLWVGHP